VPSCCLCWHISTCVAHISFCFNVVVHATMVCHSFEFFCYNLYKVQLIIFHLFLWGHLFCFTSLLVLLVDLFNFHVHTHRSSWLLLIYQYFATYSHNLFLLQNDLTAVLFLGVDLF
jgi:hypothetical protein